MLAALAMAMTLALPQQANSGVQCDPMQYSIHIIDEGRGGGPYRSLDRVSDPLFKQFIVSVTDHVIDRLDPDDAAQQTSQDSAPISLWFIRRPLVSSDPTSHRSAIPQDEPAPNGARRLDSPWVKLLIGPPESCFVRGVFIWSERQFLVDQAIMAGADASASDPQLPVSEEEFERLAEDYADNVMLAAEEEKAGAQARASERIPPEFLWLFRQAPQSDYAPFSMFVQDALHKTIQRAASGYTGIVKALVRHRFSTTHEHEQIDTVRELGRVFVPDEYAIDQLR